MDRLSKSKRKKDSLRRQALGEALIELRDEELASLGLPDRLADAVRQAREMHQHGALKRQKQYIGRLMRDVDIEPIRKVIDNRQAVSLEQRRRFHDAEQWRDRLLAAGSPQEEIEACCNRLHLDRKRVRSLIDNATNAQSPKTRKTASRELFRLLHDALDRP